MDDRTAREARLAALGAHLAARRFDVELTEWGLQVTNPPVPERRASVVMAGDVITCSRRRGDGSWWYFTSWREPIAPADQVADAAAYILGYLTRRPGTEAGR